MKGLVSTIYVRPQFSSPGLVNEFIIPVSLYLEIGMGKSLHLGWIRVRQTDVSVVM